MKDSELELLEEAEDLVKHAADVDHPIAIAKAKRDALLAEAKGYIKDIGGELVTEDELLAKQEDEGIKVTGSGLPSNMIHKSSSEYPNEFAMLNSTYIRDSPKVGRNAKCPCGSDRKFKRCHGRRGVIENE